MASVGGAKDKRLVARHIYQVIRYLIHHCSFYACILYMYSYTFGTFSIVDL